MSHSYKIYTSRLLAFKRFLTNIILIVVQIYLLYPEHLYKNKYLHYKITSIILLHLLIILALYYLLLSIIRIEICEIRDSELLIQNRHIEFKEIKYAYFEEQLSPFLVVHLHNEEKIRSYLHYCLSKKEKDKLIDGLSQKNIICRDEKDI